MPPFSIKNNSCFKHSRDHAEVGGFSPIEAIALHLWAPPGAPFLLAIRHSSVDVFFRYHCGSRFLKARRSKTIGFAMAGSFRDDITGLPMSSHREAFARV